MIMENQNQLVAQPQQRALSVKQVKDHVAIVNQLLKEVLKEGKVENGKIVKDGHYSKLPGCGEKMVLLKPGAEKLCFTFNLAPKYDKDITNIPESVDIPSGHINVDVVCELYNRVTGEFIGQGIGFCSTLEGKYRYRTKWVNGKALKEENPCIQDVYNTVIKMACKRALNHAVVQALAVGDIFMQDLDELEPNAYKDNDKPPKPEMTPPKSKSDSKNSSNTITQPQIKAVFGLFKKVMGDISEQEVCENAGVIVGIENLKSIKDLTKKQGSDIISHLNKTLEAQEKGNNDEKAPF